MCGIVGILSGSYKNSAAILPEMMNAINHRGPDASGHWINESIELGHLRLSIQDTSASANQPMRDNSGRYTIVFNGEIYNFKKLKSQLSEYYDFKTDGDTEVILAAWNRWGCDSLIYLEGMFAFALWDSYEQKLYLVRDRFGEKPLYFFTLPDHGVVFASELKSLLKHPICPRDINPAAISQFLSLNYTLTDQCIIDGIHKLPPAHFMVFAIDESPVTKQYWDLSSVFKMPKWDASEAELQEQFDELFLDVVEDCSLSDVSLGLFLSGGMDSSAIAASMARNDSAEHLKAFTIGFADASFDELDKAKLIASQKNLEHFWEISPSESSASVRKIVQNSDEPFADTSMIPMYHLSKLARKNVTVCLSGDGGDELFGGYETYLADKLHKFFKHMPLKSLALKAVDLIPTDFGKVSFDYKLKQFVKGLSLSSQEAHYSWRTIFGCDEKINLLKKDRQEIATFHNPFSSFNKFYEDVKDCNLMEQHFYVDLKTWMVDDILVKVDRMSMLHSLEVRAPFLNHRLAEWIIRLPTKYKLNGFCTKYFLKKSQEKFLPKSIIYGKKEGFSSPVSGWMTASMIDEIIENSFMQEWFNTDQIVKLWQDHKSGRLNCSYKLFGLFCLSLWMAKFKEQNVN
jgi:asparagine synthase (glutamine-hydrolysing)